MNRSPTARIDVAKESNRLTDCPHCHRQIEINEMNYGTLFSCPLCNAVFFVGWDGQPELPPTAEEMEAENQPDPPFENPELAVETEMAFMPIENSPQETIIDNSDYQGTNYESLPGGSDEVVQEQTYEAAPVEEQVYAADEQAPAVEENYDFSQPLDADSIPIPGNELSTADKPGFQDITDFGNADTTVGALTYTLRIEGIDTGRIYGELKEALTDSRFGWDMPELVKTIKDGTLEIPRLNPAKAFVLVNRIKYLNLQVSWRQDVLSAP